MIKELMHDPIFLAGKSELATKEDLQVAKDLLDTLMAHRESCVGMAANMIGVRKRYYDAFDAFYRDGNAGAMIDLIAEYVDERLDEYLAVLSQ